MTAPVLTNGSGGSAIAMTAPVISTSNVMSFILPSSIQHVADAPVPLNPQVTLRQLPQRDVAYERVRSSPPPEPLSLTTSLRALTFWGGCDEDTASSHAKLLFAALQSSSIVSAAAAMPPHLLARYNPPFTVWFMKKNEVLIDLAGFEGVTL